MPVVRIDLGRFAKMVSADRETILDRLPFVGLDIEGVDAEHVRVEYSPNRPDLGSDYGIARSLRGLLGKELGIPRYRVSKSGVSVTADRRLSKVRPFIACATIKGLKLNDEDIRQMVSLQEDLHNGLGRRRRTAAIGLHDLDSVKAPLSYRTVDSRFRFKPLGGVSDMSIEEILDKLPEGRAYGGSFTQSELYPVIVDSASTVLSFPPVINGDATKVTQKTRNVFIDVTSTDAKTGDDVLAVMVTTLAEIGGEIGTVTVRESKVSRITPDLSPNSLPLDLDLVRTLLGVELTAKQVSQALARSRMEVRGRRAVAPRYRIDLMHPVDIAEEVALGYGFDRIGSVYPASPRPGSFNAFEEFLDSAATVMAESGMAELMTFELVDDRTLYSNFGRPSSSKISVHEPRSSDHSLLRDSLLPTLMSALSSNVKSEYPQRVFEVGRVYIRKERSVSEEWHLGCLVAHSQAAFSEAKMYLESACRLLTGQEASASAAEHWAFSNGRCASVEVSGKVLGYVGELTPESIEAFGVKVPVSGFEIDLTAAHELLK